MYSGQRITELDSGVTPFNNIAAAGSANTKGTFQELIASTVHEADAILVTLRANTAADCLVDIALGANPDEYPIIANLPAHMEANSFIIGGGFRFPLFIPVGSRITARAQSGTGSATVAVQVHLIKGGALKGRSYSRCVTYGANTADSGGTSIDPGGTINTKGSWISIATTIAPINFLQVCFGNQNNGTRTNGDWFVDIGIGTDQLIIPNLLMTTNAVHDTLTPMGYGIDVDIPIGTPLIARASCTINDATDRLFDLILLGVG